MQIVIVSPSFVWNSHHHVPTRSHDEFGPTSLSAFPACDAACASLNRGCSRVRSGRPRPYAPDAREGVQGAVQGRVVPPSSVYDVTCERICKGLIRPRERVDIQVLESAKLLGHFHNGKLAVEIPYNVSHNDW